jgi:hypothetical protein
MPGQRRRSTAGQHPGSTCAPAPRPAPPRSRPRPPCRPPRAVRGRRARPAAGPRQTPGTPPWCRGLQSTRLRRPAMQVFQGGRADGRAVWAGGVCVRRAPGRLKPAAWQRPRPGRGPATLRPDPRCMPATASRPPRTDARRVGHRYGSVRPRHRHGSRSPTGRRPRRHVRSACRRGRRRALGPGRRHDCYWRRWERTKACRAQRFRFLLVAAAVRPLSGRRCLVQGRAAPAAQVLGARAGPRQ